MDRRGFLTQCAAGLAAAVPARSWDAGRVAHLLPTVNDRSIRLKASFREPLGGTPRLRAGSRAAAGGKTDSEGLFWTFDVAGLEPGQQYELSLQDHAGRALCEPWKLATFPAPSQRPSKLRLLVYTCAGGHDALRDEKGDMRFLSVARRRRLLDRALSFQPDALIADGDHVYWDLLSDRTSGWLGASPYAVGFAGRFERSLPVLGSANEAVFKKAVGPQVAELYGTRCRSVPVFFIQDDHDYFDNDDANDKIVTFPPDFFMLELGRQSRRLFYPEFLPDGARPAGLPDSVGTLRYGRLAELLLYDCRRYMTLAGPTGTFVPPEAEAWLTGRMRAEGVAHVINVPSVPVGWSAGKWGEWYADILDEKGRLGLSRPKPYWQTGWRAQHDRLLAASSSMKDRIPLFLNGDLHSLGETRIYGSGALSFRANPVVSLLTGPIGTDGVGWPSRVRGVRAETPQGLEVEERLPALEQNGFSILDFTDRKITVRMFRWNVSQPDSAMDTLEPFHVVELERP